MCIFFFSFYQNLLLQLVDVSIVSLMTLSAPKGKSFTDIPHRQRHTTSVRYITWNHAIVQTSSSNNPRFESRLRVSILKATFDLIALSLLAVAFFYINYHTDISVCPVALRVIKQCIDSSKYFPSRLHKTKVTHLGKDTFMMERMEMQRFLDDKYLWCFFFRNVFYGSL